MLGEIWQAVVMLFSLDHSLYQVIWLTLYVSGSAVLLAALIGVPLGTVLGMKPVAKVRWITRLTYTFMGLPPVVGGLFIFLLLSKKGALGSLGLIWTPTAMIIVQVLLALPIIVGLTSVAVRSKGKEVLDTLRSLGAERRLILWVIMRESRYGILGAVITGFGRVVGEVGAVILVGGNIEGRTRVMSTAILLEVRQGNFAFAMALGLLLLAISFVINAGLYRLQAGGADE